MQYAKNVAFPLSNSLLKEKQKKSVVFSDVFLCTLFLENKLFLENFCLFACFFLSNE